MIEIFSVLGEVIVEDKKNATTQVAKSGLRLADGGQYLIVTSPSSTAILLDSVKKTKFELKPSSYMWINCEKRYHGPYHGFWGTTRFIAGKLWAKIVETFGDPDKIPDAPNDANGVRG
jgi:hypothetical protein